MADWLRANEVETILGPLTWDEIGRPQGDFLLAQWQSGEVNIVAPSIAATTDKVVFPKPAWKN
jgi:branched-chain amino acid transport system substrate-binding protein